MGAGRGFGVILNSEGGDLAAAETFERVVVEIYVSKLDVFVEERIGVNAKAVILAGNFNFSRD